MATGIYVGNSTAKKVKGIYIGVSNISKKLKRAYIGAGGDWRDYGGAQNSHSARSSSYHKTCGDKT